LLKNDFLVKPELSASRVLLSLPWAAVDAPVASAPVALPAERKGLILGILGIMVHIRTYKDIKDTIIIIIYAGDIFNDVYNTRNHNNVVISL
jgi:hypothetical protein